MNRYIQVLRLLQKVSCLAEGFCDLRKDHKHRSADYDRYGRQKIYSCSGKIQQSAGGHSDRRVAIESELPTIRNSNLLPVKANGEVLFRCDGYADEWVREAERRGLPNIKSMVEAASALTTDKSIRLFAPFPAGSGRSLPGPASR